MKHLITITTLLLVGILACGFADTASATIAFPEKSPGKITFIGDAGSPNVFTVNNWKFTRVENPDRPENIGITAMLDVASITCDWKDLEKNVLKKKEYFHSKKWKTASITIDGATLQRDGSYLAEAQLELKGIRKEIPISFTIGGGDNNEPYTVSATATVMRRNWRFSGDGPKDEVPVSVDATLVVW